MSDDRLTPEERAVLNAAAQWRDRFQSHLEGLIGADSDTGIAALVAARDAVDAYRKAAAPPEPFEAKVYRDPAGKWDDVLYDVDKPTPINPGHPLQVWRCTVTPIERVR